MSGGQPGAGWRLWTRSFTRPEAALTALQAALLLALGAAIAFLLLHLMACGTQLDYAAASKQQTPSETPPTSAETSPTSAKTPLASVKITTASAVTPTASVKTAIASAVTRTAFAGKATTKGKMTKALATYTTSSIECTWRQSLKTEPSARFYYSSNRGVIPKEPSSRPPRIYPEIAATPNVMKGHTANVMVDIVSAGVPEPVTITDSVLDTVDLSVGEEAHEYKSVVLALVKINSNQITFGCILTVIARHWTLTAASCLEVISDVESFVMLQGYSVHLVTDVRIHPLYQSMNHSYDVATLKTAHDLVGGGRPMQLATLLDHLLITAGERFTRLGYGSCRSADTEQSRRGLRQASVHSLPRAQCASGQSASAEGWSRSRGSCTTCLCAGALYSRGTCGTYGTCGQCAGAPLVRDWLVLGVLVDGDCEPALYVSLAHVAPWITSTVHS